VTCIIGFLVTLLPRGWHPDPPHKKFVVLPIGTSAASSP